LQQLSQF